MSDQIEAKQIVNAGMVTGGPAELTLTGCIDGS